jgi:hypothetical protein
MVVVVVGKVRAVAAVVVAGGERGKVRIVVIVQGG